MTYFRRDHVADELWVFWETIAETLFWVLDFQHAGQNTLDSGFNYVGQYWMPYIVFEKYLIWLLY